MEDFHESMNGFGENGHHHHVGRQSPRLSWLDLRVFYVRVSKCEVDDSIPEYLTLNHIPLNRDTLLEVNGVRTSIYSDGVSTLLRRDRLDKKSEEVTFVTTDTVRITGSVKFEVSEKDVVMLSGALELCYANGFLEEPQNHGDCWSISFDSDIGLGKGFLKGNQHTSLESTSPAIEVYVAGCFRGSPIILTKTLQLSHSHRRKQMRKGMLESIPENEDSERPTDVSSGHALQVAEYSNYKPEDESYGNLYPGMQYLEGEDGDLSWFNAGVRVGVGIGLSICLGVGIGAGLLVKAYHGTTRNFMRRLF